LKNAKEGRERAKIKKQTLKTDEEKEKQLEEEKRLKDPVTYISNLKKRRLDIMQKKEDELTINKQEKHGCKAKKNESDHR